MIPLRNTIWYITYYHIILRHNKNYVIKITLRKILPFHAFSFPSLESIEKRHGIEMNCYWLMSGQMFDIWNPLRGHRWRHQLNWPVHCSNWQFEYFQTCLQVHSDAIFCSRDRKPKICPCKLGTDQSRKFPVRRILVRWFLNLPCSSKFQKMRLQV